MGAALNRAFSLHLLWRRFSDSLPALFKLLCVARGSQRWRMTSCLCCGSGQPCAHCLDPCGSSSSSVCEALCRTLAVQATKVFGILVLPGWGVWKHQNRLPRAVGHLGLRGVFFGENASNSLEKKLKFRICSKSDCNLFYFLLR